MSIASEAPTRLLSNQSRVVFKPAAARTIDPTWPVLDRYEIIGELGRGGMGVVYHARDRILDRPVALKMILPPHADSADGLKRFFDEADAVAKLRHPGVVQIYEVSKYNGRPFLVLEYIDGQNLSQRLAEGPIAPAEAASLVRSIADTIDFAHAQGVIHRDLKPANILLQTGSTVQRTKTPAPDRPLEPHGRPKVTDFGIAKRLDENNDLTRTGMVIGTPQYMAPEQAAHARTEHTPAIDIYALGAILYECLTGRPPFVGVDGADVIIQLRTADPIPPTRLRPGIPRDLETICLKCLERDPHRRYDTAEDLAADLEHFLNGEPIVARPASIVERIAKWVRRQPALAAAVSVCVAAVMMLIVGGVSYTIRLRESLAEAHYQSNRAEANFQKAFTAVEQMLDQVGSDQLERIPKTEKLRRELLTRALNFYDGFLAERGNDPKLRCTTALAYAKVGDIQKLLGAIPESTAAHQAARELYVALVAEEPDNDNLKYNAAIALLDIGSNQVEHGVGQHAVAAEALSAGITELLTLPPNENIRAIIASSTDALARCYRELGRLDDSDRLHREAYAQYAQLLAEHPGDRKITRGLATARVNWSRKHESAGHDRQSIESLRPAVESLRRLVADEPDDCGCRVALSCACNQLSSALRQVPGRGDECVQLIREAKRHLEAAVVMNPVVTEYRHRLVMANGNLIEVLTALGKIDEVPTLEAASAEMLTQLVKEMPNEPQVSHSFAVHSFNAAVHCRMRGEAAKSETNYHAAVTALEPIVTARPDARSSAVLLCMAERGLASLLSDGPNAADGEPLIRRSIARLEHLRGRFSDNFEIEEQMALGFDALNQVLQGLGRYPEAIEAGKRAIELSERLFAQSADKTESQCNLAGIIYNTAYNYTYLRHFEEMLPLLDHGIELLEKALAQRPTSSSGVRYMCNHHGLRAIALARLGRDEDAVTDLENMAKYVGNPMIAASAGTWFAKCCMLAAIEDPLGPRRAAARRYAAIALQHHQKAKSLGAADPGPMPDDAIIAMRLLLSEIAPWAQ